MKAMKMKTYFAFCVLIVSAWISTSSARAEVLLNSWTYAGGGLSPITYGTFRPSVLNPDAAASNGATIGISGLTSGGLGSSSFPDGYEFLYTFFSTSTTVTLQTSNVLAGVETISLSYNSGGLTSYNASSLLLNFNLGNSALVADDFSAVAGGASEFGDLTIYTWTWDVAELGASSGFSTSWSAGQHTAFGDIQLIQSAIPEPSTTLLLGLAMAAVAGRRHLKKRSIL